jgi:hypothetical protein
MIRHIPIHISSRPRTLGWNPVLFCLLVLIQAGQVSGQILQEEYIYRGNVP